MTKDDGKEQKQIGQHGIGIVLSVKWRLGKDLSSFFLLILVAELAQDIVALS